MENQYNLNQTLKQLIEVLQCQCDSNVVVEGNVNVDTGHLNKESTQLEIQGALDTFRSNTQTQLSEIFSNLQTTLSNNQINSKSQIERLEELIQAVQGTFSGNNLAQELTLRDFKTKNLEKLQNILDAILDNTSDTSGLAQENTLNNFYIRNHADLLSIKGALDEVILSLDSLFDNSGLAMESTLLTFSQETNANFQELISKFDENRPVDLAYNSDKLLNRVEFENGLVANITYDQHNLMQTITWVEP